MKVKILIFVLFIISSNNTFPQKRAWNWTFGNHVRLNFSNGTPALNNSALATSEGCATMSDTLGNLLFSTDGITVFNALQDTMTNGTGLLGHPSSTQSAIIVLQPGSDSIFYIFTISSFHNALFGLNYSIVNMALNAGLGAVTTKNVLVYTDTRERLTALKHTNGLDYWIIINASNGSLHSYLLTSSGLSTVPVISNVNVPNSIGYLKGNLQNNKIAIASYFQGQFDLLDFDNSTGFASNKISIQSSSSAPFSIAYGVEFSPDGSLLYGTTMNSSFKVIQYNLNAGSPSAIASSGIILASQPTKAQCSWGYWYGSIQTGPDGNIYCVSECDSNINVINYPNIIGSACNFVPQGVSLNGRTSTLGLPNIMPDYLAPPITNLPVELKLFSVSSFQNKVKLNWITASEINNDYFTIQRASNEIPAFWEDLLKVKGNGNSTNDITYVAQDVHPFYGVSYYRLKQTDYDGNSKTFESQAIDINFGEINIFPNPVNDFLEIRVDQNCKFYLNLYSLEGKRMDVEAVKMNQCYMIDLSSIPNGIYILNIDADDRCVKQSKIIVQHIKFN